MRLQIENAQNLTPDRAVNTALIEGVVNGEKMLIQLTPLKVMTKRAGEAKTRNGAPVIDERTRKVQTYSGDQIMSLGSNSVRLSTSIGTVQYGAYANLLPGTEINNGAPFDISALLKG